MTSLTHPNYRADIDGLRAIAVIAVVGFHSFPGWFKGGFVGVDVFFVISGFLISSIIFQNLSLSRFSYIEFYARRIRRIFPALILVLAFCLVFGWVTMLPFEYANLSKHIGGVHYLFQILYFGVNLAILILLLNQSHFSICGHLGLKNNSILFGLCCLDLHGSENRAS